MSLDGFQSFMLNVHIPITSFRDPYDLQWPASVMALLSRFNVQWTDAPPTQPTGEPLTGVGDNYPFLFASPLNLILPFYDQQPCPQHPTKTKKKQGPISVCGPPQPSLGLLHPRPTPRNQHLRHCVALCPWLGQSLHTIGLTYTFGEP